MVTRGCLKSWFYTQNGVTMGLARVGGMCTKQHNCVIGNLSSIKNHRLHQQHYQHHHQHHHQESLEWPIDRANLIHLLASQLSMSWLTRFAELCELIIFIAWSSSPIKLIYLRWSSLPTWLIIFVDHHHQYDIVHHRQYDIAHVKGWPQPGNAPRQHGRVRQGWVHHVAKQRH